MSRAEAVQRAVRLASRALVGPLPMAEYAAVCRATFEADRGLARRQRPSR